MHRQQRHRDGERGAGALELVGLVAAVAVLLAAAAVPLSGEGGRAMGVRAAATLERALGGGGRGTAGARRAVRGERVERAGEQPPAGDDLQLAPVLGPYAWRKRTASWQSRRGGLRHHAEGKACVLCGGAGGRAHSALGATGTREGRDKSGGRGFGIEGHAHAYASLAAAEATYWAAYALGPLSARGQLRGLASVGLDASGRGTLVASRRRQELELGGTAVAGATARGEQRASVRFMGVALQETAGVEGWAGAGATGHLHLARSGRGRYRMRLRGGGAWGLGGAADIAASVDASELLADPQRAVDDVLRLIGEVQRWRT